ncbi:MAG: flippase-like domain-containing protein [Solirubrobacterales bacterium]|nr:flippase-like domain-containing protein [Solirubrobacterales bacterium]
MRKLARLLRRHRRAVGAAVVIAAIVGFVYFVVPELSGLSGTLRRLRHADLWWIALGFVVEAISLAGYGLLFRTVFSCHGVHIGWRESYQITLAGTVASKLLSTAGAGGVALTVWALRASGLQPRVIARRMVTFELLLYSVFAGALLIFGAGLRIGVLPGQAPWTLTVVPAVIAAAAITLTVALAVLPLGLERRITAGMRSSRRLLRMLSRVATAPQTLRESTRIAFAAVRGWELGVLGAPAYWGFDIAALWAALHAFGSPPPVPAIVMAYFIGQLANVLPIPGGVGGVEGGTIGALLAFGAQGSVALLGVLAYRLISFWLPTIPGALAYFRLRRTVGGWRSADAARQTPG